jgi:hypothetical protein
MKTKNKTVISPATADETEVLVRLAAPAETAWFDQQMADRHFQGAGRPVGDYLRQVVEVGGAARALLV